MAYIGKTPSQAVRSRYFYTATGGETSLSGADDNGDTLIFADGNYVDVYLNGVLLVASSDYNVNTVNTIAGLTALTASDIVEIVVYDTFSVFGGTFQGTLTANQFVGPLTGNVTGELNGAINFIVKNLSGGTITKGTPVYISGHSGNTPEVNVADADDPAKMPAIGVATEDFNNNTQGNIVTFGDLIGFNTAAFSVNDELYVSTTGTLTATRPNASNTEVQKIAKVVRSHSTNGQLFIMGAGRSNDVPNAITTNSINLGSTTTVDSVLDEDAMTSDSATALATQQSIKAYVDSQIGSNNELSEILTNGNTTGGNDISFGDSDKAIFGAGSDLQIYHDGLNSYIQDSGTGDLILSSSTAHRVRTDHFQINNAANTEEIISGVANGAVTLRYDGSSKFSTTATGVNVTGTITSDGLSVDGTLTVNGTGGQITTDNNGFITSKQSLDVGTAGGRFIGKSNRGELGQIAIEQTATGADGGYIRFSTSPSGSTSPTERLRIDSSGNLIKVGGVIKGERGTAAAPAYSFSDDTDTGMFNISNANLGFAVGGSEHMRITSNGNVGINRTPSYELDVGPGDNAGSEIRIIAGSDSGADAILRLQCTATAGTRDSAIYFGDSANTSIGRITYGHANNDFRFFTNGTERMRINSSGSVGIGTSSPIAQSKLTVAGNSLSLTGSDANFGAGGVRGMLDLAGGYLRMGAVNGGGTANGVKLIAPSGAEAVVVDNSGRVTMPYQPSFSVSRNQGDVSSGTYIFSSAYHNTGNHYNSSNGRFTAPITGLYFFSTNMMSSNAGTYNNSYYEITKNGSQFQRVYSSNGASVHHRWNWSGVIYLNANDWISVDVPGGSALVLYGGGNEYTTFTGFLVG